MYEMLYVRGKNIVTYQDYHLEFLKGLSTIRGPNRSGKSLSLSVMGNILYSTPPVVKKKNAARTLLDSSGSVCAMAWRKGKFVYHIEQHAKGKGVGYRIYKHKASETFDPKKHNMNVRGDVKAIIRKFFQQKDDLFYNVSYISGAKPNPLQHGSAPDRYKFFQNLFNLDVYDKIRKKLAKELEGLSKDAATLSYLRGERERLPESLDIAFSKKALKKYQKRYDGLHGKVKTAQDKVTELTAIVTLRRQLSDPKMTLDVAVAKGKKLQAEIKELVAREEELLKIQGQAEQQAELEATRRDLEEKLSKLSKVKGKLSEVNAEVMHLQEDLPRIEHYLEVVEQNASVEGRIRDLTAKLGKTELLSVEVLAKKSEKVQGVIASAQETIDVMSELEGHKECPTCKHGIDAKTVSKLLKEATAKRDAAMKDAVLYKVMRQIHELTDKLLDVPKLPKEHKNPTRELIEKLEDQLDRESKRAKFLELKKTLNEKLELLPKAKKVKDVSLDLEQTQTKLEKSRERLEALRNDIKVLRQLAEYKGSLDTAGQELDAAQAVVDKLGPRIQKVNSKVQRLKLEVADLTFKKDRIEELDGKIAELAEKTKEIPIYQALIKAYGPKGLRVDRTQEFAEVFIDRMNQYAPMIFGEPFKFSVNIGPNRFDIIAERSGHKSDINLLSASETRCFQLLSFLALLSMVPKAMRTNFVVLDEIEANMDDKSQALYANEFLPKLKALVDVIFVVTPLSEEKFFIDVTDHKYQVFKGKGVSKLKKVA